ncbi:hypothetical protein FXF51_06165 [Nonomuraea sp. PA05]|uniref:hypothetical protein n=1 Tax=Nonomuraea sp. PA05 TaxID=2604466 RepID=UPI0011D9E4A5|nr:hypothetical protein [Nonomuraea sp. PA05]TYB69745.1 hypothetical protein FXF51_06165 [Nonomuraea sp. PA05]
MQPWPYGEQPPGSQPYGPPQPPPNPYGQRYAPQQQPSYTPVPANHRAAQRSQGLAITTVALGIVAIILAATPLRGIGLLVGLVTAVLAIIALAARSQGGTMFAVTGLVLAMLSLPVALLMYMWATESAESDADRQKALQECIAANPEKVLECAGWE